MRDPQEKATRRWTRTHNSRLVLRTIYDHAQISRADVARLTGLTRPTVSSVVAGLLKKGLVEEVGRGPSVGGKPPILLSVADDARQVISLDLARSEFHGALVNLRGSVQRRIVLPLRGRDGEAALALVYELVDALVKEASSPLLGIGIGTPGLVDANNGVVHQAVNLDWQDVPLRRLLRKRYKLPVYVANDCHVAALAEYTFGHNEGVGDLVVIKAGWGIGAGIVLGGHLVCGNPFGAGEIGHVKIAENGERCRCGNVGCLETVASSRALIRRAQAIARSDPHSLLHQFAADSEAITLDTVLQAFEAGDETVRQAIGEAGRSLGIAAASLVGVLAVRRILIAGSVARFGQFLVDALRESMARHALPSLAGNTEVGIASLGSDIVLMGASALVLSQELGLT
jgi:glucokinase-like ROK family protein